MTFNPHLYLSPMSLPLSPHPTLTSSRSKVHNWQAAELSGLLHQLERSADLLQPPGKGGKREREKDREETDKQRLEDAVVSEERGGEGRGGGGKRKFKSTDNIMNH